MTPATYRIETLTDILRVPAESRPALFHDLEAALALHEFVYADEAQSVAIGSLLWTDDADHSVTMQDNTGQQILNLEVTEEEQP